MTRAGTFLIAGMMVGTGSVGCYQGADGFGPTSERGVSVQGVQLQGVRLQGISLQGIRLQGISLQGLKLQGIRLQGLNLQGLQLQGITLQGLTLQGLTLQGMTLQGTQIVDGETVNLSGNDFIGTELRLDVDDGQGGETAVTVTIDDIYPAPEAKFDDVLAYEVSYKIAGEDVARPLCVDDANVAWPAYIFSGYWDEETGDFIDEPDTISFACHFGVVAKCALWGYRPWAESEQCKKGKKGKKSKGCETVSLRDYHQACTRMARADYCGNGEPWTVDGTQINIYDQLSPQIQEDEAPADWQIEAEWTPDGAYCLSDIRHQGWKAEGLYPNCGKAFNKHNKKIKDCGSLKKHRALLVSSFDPETY